MFFAGGSKSEFLDVSIDYKGRFTGATTNTAMTYDSHVEGIGWQGYTTDNTIGGTTGVGKRLEAFRISYDSSLGSGGISYASSVKGKDKDGKMRLRLAISVGLSDSQNP